MNTFVKSLSCETSVIHMACVKQPWTCVTYVTCVYGLTVVTYVICVAYVTCVTVKCVV